jgi:2,3-bisphosphoglycerate-independent phosphoglycerate mutase
VSAVRIIDEKIGTLVEAATKSGTTLLITADHGNAEDLLDIQTGEKDTRHNPNPVPFYIVDERLRRSRTSEEIEESERFMAGTLCDIAPTVLELMGIPKPAEMTGQSILSSIT